MNESARIQSIFEWMNHDRFIRDTVGTQYSLRDSHQTRGDTDKLFITIKDKARWFHDWCEQLK